MLPEMIVCPFTIDASLLVMLPLACGACYQEGGIEQVLTYPPEFDWKRVDEPGIQHWIDIGFDPDANPSWYPIWAARPVEHTADAVIYRMGLLPQSDGTFRTPFTK